MCGVLNGNVTYTDSAYDYASGADMLVIVTEWEQFRARPRCDQSGDDCAGDGGPMQYIRQRRPPNTALLI